MSQHGKGKVIFQFNLFLFYHRLKYFNSGSVVREGEKNPRFTPFFFTLSSLSTITIETLIYKREQKQQLLFCFKLYRFCYKTEKKEREKTPLFSRFFFFIYSTFTTLFSTSAACLSSPSSCSLVARSSASACLFHSFASLLAAAATPSLACLGLSALSRYEAWRAAAPTASTARAAAEPAAGLLATQSSSSAYPKRSSSTSWSRAAR